MYVSLDLETTGINPQTDKIIEFGAIKFNLNGEILDKKTFLINPGIRLPDIITHITNIKNEDLKSAPKITEKIQEIKDFISKCAIVGHNIKFDLEFLEKAGIEISTPFYDTFQISGIALPNLPSYSLEIISHELSLTHEEKHRALDDSIAAMELFLKLIEKFKELPSNIFNEITILSRKSQWSFKNILSEIKNSPASLQEKTTNSDTIILSCKDAEKLISIRESCLFECKNDYENIALNLINKIDKTSYISAPKELFETLSATDPKNLCTQTLNKNYISTKRLEEFKTKTFFEEHEITSLIKYIIWLSTTKTGLLKEINLFGDEYLTLNNINADEDFLTEEELKNEKFLASTQKKDNSLPSLISHEFLLKNPPKNATELYIIDADKLLKTAFYENSKFLNLDFVSSALTDLKNQNPENPSIESLISKTSILFGLIGVLFEKYNDGDPYGKKANLSLLNQSSKEWQDITFSIKNLIEISFELKDILNPKNAGYLKKWKKILETLQSAFISPDFNKNIILLEEDYKENLTLRMYDLNFRNCIGEALNSAKTYKIIDEAINLNEEGKFIKNILNLPQELPLICSDEKTPSMKISILNEDNDMNTLKELLTFIKNKKGKIALLFNSKKMLEDFTLTISKNLHAPDINIVSQTIGSINKIGEQFKKSPENSVLLITSASFVNFPYTELLDTIFIHKIPFDSPSNPLTVTLAHNLSNSFELLQIPSAAIALKRILTRVKQENSHIIIGDSRIHKKDYNKPIFEFLKTLGEIEIADIKSILKN
ncbi:MAG: exonuclease domain-containing protein [Candidatus Gracilibacteria bacterium]|jgi:DNA polymerase III epsilon subunit family exonuclease